MRVILDSNIIIFGLQNKDAVFSIILKSIGMKFSCVIPQLVLDEVFQRLKNLEGKDFASYSLYMIKTWAVQIIANELIPSELIVKYRKKGIKDGDATIAAFAEWIKADYLVTENRDFLKQINVNFKVINAKEFIRVIYNEI